MADSPSSSTSVVTDPTDSAKAPQPEATVQPAWVRLISLPKDASDDQIKILVHEQLQSDLEDSSIAPEYNVLFLYDEVEVMRSDTDLIYRSVTGFDATKPLLLILDSGGGDVGAAYFIAKLCREYSSPRFEVAVPRRAKSAATLICCGAERIHMGGLSELGPIDPQFKGGIPALALKNSIEHLAELTKRHPQATELFASYLAKTLRIEALGYYERVAESAAQYAERLLKARRGALGDGDGGTSIAQRLLYMYKDHGFVIDAQEAIEIFGGTVVKVKTAEYDLANSMYLSLDLLGRIVRDRFSRYFAFTGTATTGCQLRRMSSTS
jgi:hypothetical protein